MQACKPHPLDASLPETPISEVQPPDSVTAKQKVVSATHKAIQRVNGTYLVNLVSRQSGGSWSGGSLGYPRILPWCPSDTDLHVVQRTLGHPRILSRGSLGHPGILPWCPLRHWPPWCPEDPWTSWDPPLVSPQTLAPVVSGGSLGHPGMCLRGHEGRILGCPRDPPDSMGQLCERDMKGGSRDVQGILWTAWAAV